MYIEIYQIYKGTYAEVILSYIVDTIGSPIAILCDLTLQTLRIFSRLSTLSCTLGVDSVLFTKIQQGSFGYAEKFCSSPPCTGAIISL